MEECSVIPSHDSLLKFVSYMSSGAGAKKLDNDKMAIRSLIYAPNIPGSLTCFISVEYSSYQMD